MRAVFSVVSLLIVLAVVGVLVKKQLGSTVPAVSVNMPLPGAAGPATSPNATAQAQSQQIQQQVRQAVEASLQQARPMLDDK